MTVVDVNIRKNPQHKAEMDNTDIIVTSLTKVQLSGYAYQKQTTNDSFVSDKRQL
jgi:hypothetical protein